MMEKKKGLKMSIVREELFCNGGWDSVNYSSVTTAVPPQRPRIRKPENDEENNVTLGNIAFRL